MYDSNLAFDWLIEPTERMGMKERQSVWKLGKCFTGATMFFWLNGVNE